MSSNASRAALSTAAIALLAATGVAEAKPAPRPDLRVQSLQVVAGSAKPGAAIRVRETTVNSGARGARKNVTALLLSKDAKRDAADVGLGGRKLRRLRAGRSSLRARTVLIPKTVKPGAYRLLSCADAKRRVRESNERNNCTSIALTVAAPASGNPKPPTKKPPVDPPPPKPAAYLVISPSKTLLMGVGDSHTSSTTVWTQGLATSIAYNAEAYDADGNDLGDATDTAVWAISPDGDCALGTCSAVKAGLHHIVASLGSAQGTVNVQVRDPDVVCRGESYDVNGLNADGCEKAQPAPGHTTRETATSLGAKTCNDGLSAGSFKGTLLSDRRGHDSPLVAGFDGSSGSAPAWFSVLALGSLGPSCVKDFEMTIKTTGGTSQKCYRLSMHLAVDPTSDFYDTYSVDVTGNGSGTLSKAGSVYDTGSSVYFEVQKICSDSVHEKVDYLVSYHL
jgi:hypothetical protein